MKSFSWALVGLLLAFPALAAEGGGDANIFAGDLGNMIWTLVIFVLVLVVLGKFAWGPILEGLQGREDFIRKSLEEAKADREAAEARLHEYEAKLAEARAEATAIVEEGRRDAEVVKQSIESDAREEAQKTVERSIREINQAKVAAIEEVYNAASSTAVDLAAHVIRKELSAEDHERLIAEAAQKMRDARSAN